MLYRQFDENIANRKMEDDFRDCLESAIQGQRAGSGKRTVARPITDLDKQIAETRRFSVLFPYHHYLVTIIVAMTG